MNKLAVIGRGTAGCLAVAFFERWTDYEIDWYFDPNVQPQAVGEGSQLNLPSMMKDTMAFNFADWKTVDGNYKTGIHYRNWGSKDFFHNFLPPSLGMHFNAVKLQDLIVDKYKSKVNIKHENVIHDKIDADFIFDCSGKPKSYDDFHMSDYIPVNSVHVTQCFWDAPTFDYTVTCARKYGWVFGIPLQNRCSIGYLYNNNFNSVDDVKEDVKVLFEDYNLTPSTTTNSFSFKNYYRKKNFDGRVVYGGNASFFLEPMEATSILTMEFIQRLALDYWDGIDEDYNSAYLDWQKECEHIIMMHYAAGSRFQTPFWDFAQQRGQQCLEKASDHGKWKEFIAASKNYNYGDYNGREYGGGWAYHSFKENLEGLELNV